MNFYEKIYEIAEKDQRYKPDAYEFVMQALWFTQQKMGREGHVTGRELLEGIKEFGLNQYGPMTRTVFEHWGVKTTEDFGEIVFAMVENGLMSATDTDSRDGFKDVYNFHDVFDSENVT
jgi:uncharacterized repeat protein (TIGR04138 family)